MRHVLVLGDQLNRTVGPLADAEPAETVVLLVEAADWASRRPYHRQKLVLIRAAMRHFAVECEAAGFQVRLRRSTGFADGLAAHLAEFPGVAIQLMEPADAGVAEAIVGAVEDHGGSLDVVPNALWLSAADEFDAWASGRKELRMELWYRAMRRRTGWLMEGEDPIGGEWNLDAANRRVPPGGTVFPAVPRFLPDEMTRAVIEEVRDELPDGPGAIEPFGWPVTRAQALESLRAFVDERLRDFGPYEDAMVDGERSLDHSLLSVALNIGLITAREACEAALAAWADPSRAADPARAIPLQSIEGFVRQLLGWREFMRHVYRTRSVSLHAANALGHTGDLPAFYWTAETRMRCVADAVGSVLETGHAHHIQRLMVLGNWALLAGVDPHQVNGWFHDLFVDAFDWVVTPNVVGMSQFAEQSFTSKPYVAGGAYIDRMSDHCARCPYDPKRSVGEDACPFTTLYWSFIDRHLPLVAANHRMGPIAGGWRKRDEADKAAIRARATEVLDRAGRGAL